MEIWFNTTKNPWLEGLDELRKIYNETGGFKKIRKHRSRLSIEFGRDFLREKVRIRDNHICQICGRIWNDGERRFDVHHLDRNIEGKEAFKYKNNKDINKMITLCHKCHLNLPHIRKKLGKRKLLTGGILL